MAKRIQRQRRKGFKLPAGTMFVGRPTIWGNPFVAGKPCGIFKAPHGLNGSDETIIESLTLDQCLEFYRTLVIGCIQPEMHPYGHDWYRNFKAKTHGAHPSEWARSILRGCDLACWCPLDQPCHADILLEIANA